MANFTTDAKICIEREVEVKNKYEQFEDLDAQFDINDTCKWITENKFERVCLQFPDELLQFSVQIYEQIKSKVDSDLYILGDTSYGSCCVDSVAAMHVEGNAVVHYGQTCFSKTNIPTFIVLPKRKLDIEATVKLIEKNFEEQNVKLCLFYDAEYEHCIETLAIQWYKAYPSSYIAFIETEDKPNRCLGRIIRNSSIEDVAVDSLKDCTCIYLGSRGQTAFTYTVSIEAADWQCVNPENMICEPMNETAWIKRRRYMVEKCKDAETVGILVCKLAGDQTRDIISRVKQLCKVNGKKSYIVSVGKPNVAKLANFPEIKIYVMIACPENDLFASRDFYCPIVYPFELEVALNTNRPQYFKNHVTDFDDLLPGRRYYCDISEPAHIPDVSLITGRIRDTKLDSSSGTMDLVDKQNYALETIGKNLKDRSWAGLEQKLGETEVKTVEEGRAGIALQYKNEP